MIRETIANGFITIGRSFGQLLGLQLAVELSDHSIKLKMEQAEQSKRAWDKSLYKNGNVFIKDYANPVKPRVEQNTGLDSPDTAAIEEGEAGEEIDQPQLEGETEASDSHAQLISSGRYRDYMRQDLISQLLTPETRWNKMLYGLIAIAALGFLNMVITLYATGTFA